MSIEATLVRWFLRLAVKNRMRPDSDIDAIRKTVDDLALIFPKPPRSVRVETTTAGDRPALLVRAKGAHPHRAILYLHGGGYVSGTTKMYRDLARRLSEAAGAAVLLPDYRLAPEHPFPAAVDDAVLAYRSMLDRGLDPSQLAIAGDSAGGGLTFATLLALRDAGIALPAAAWTISPWTDLAYRGESFVANAKADPMIRADIIRPTAEWYLGSAHPETPLASPLYAELHDLPPTLVHVGSTEVLLDDSRRIVERLASHGTRVDLRVYDDLPHVFHLFAPFVREGRHAIRDAGAFLASHWQ